MAAAEAIDSSVKPCWSTKNVALYEEDKLCCLLECMFVRREQTDGS